MAPDSPHTPGPLPHIPFVDLGERGPVALFESDPARAREIIELGRAQFGGRLISTFDALSCLWARYARNPHQDEIAELAAQLPRGVWFMNFSLEWGCTSGVMDDPTAPGMRLLRTLDWPFDGLGRNLMVARQQGPAGDYYNLTWPGFTGVVQAMAPGRFAVAINQAPLIRHLLLPSYGDWVVNKIRAFSSRRIPPVHLLRHVIENCRTYNEAQDVLTTTPLALPAIFSIVGVEREEGCVIERMERRAEVRPAPAAAANHWVGKSLKTGRPRGRESHRRHRLMNGYTRSHVTGFEWLTEPMVNPDTRLAMSANPRTGDLWVQGFETEGPATEIFDLSEHLHTSTGE